MAIQNIGDGDPFDILPPYTVVNIWRRTACARELAYFRDEHRGEARVHCEASG